MTNIDVDYDHINIDHQGLRAAADDLMSIGGWLSGFIDSGFKWDFENNPPPRGAVEDRLAGNVLLYQRFPPEERPGRQQLIAALARHLRLESPDQVWALVENYHPNAQRRVSDDELLSNIGNADSHPEEMPPPSERVDDSLS